MIKKINIKYKFDFYIDDYIKDGEIIHGHNNSGHFYISNNKTMDLIMTTIKKKIRLKKINKFIKEEI